MSARRYLCIHAHFYQPPRENPWLEEIELQDSAAPYHDWNERITAECYGPNAYSRILGPDNRIRRIVNNYERISFNFGPTLLSWLKDKAPDVYGRVLEADAKSRERFSGHGNALAQAYNHPILPLASARDKLTQIRWGIRDFETRFRRRPEGMWLPETAVDTETLELLAAEGLRFTVLEPGQARRTRKIGARAWRTAAGSVDPRHPYVVRLPSGRPFYVFFYDGPVSRAVAFEQLLTRGEHLAGRLKTAFDPHREDPQLVHIATDGETYGHHHRFGDMALAYALDTLDADPDVRLTNYGEFLDLHPPTHEVEIADNTSWSCAHGVERWRSDCGCSTNAQPGWNQAWRGPLRQALDWLRDEVSPRYEARGGELLKDPWAARDDYVSVILDRSPDNLEAFFARHRQRELSAAERTECLKLLELQRHVQLMYTSCGWFFADLGGIETVQVIQYADRVLQLAEELFKTPLEPEFLRRLKAAASNIPDVGDGERVYKRFVRPARVDMEKVGAHFAVTSFFKEHPKQMRLYAYRIRQEDSRLLTSGKMRLAAGLVSIESEITLEATQVSYAFLHFGDQHFSGGARLFRGRKEYEATVWEITNDFSKGDPSATLRALSKHYGPDAYALRSLFHDEQRKILRLLLAPAVADAEKTYEHLYAQYGGLVNFLAEIGAPPPKALQAAAELALNAKIRLALESPEPDLEKAGRLLQEVRTAGVPLDRDGLGFALERLMERLAAELRRRPGDDEALGRLERATQLLAEGSFSLDLWKVQNDYYETLTAELPRLRERGDAGRAARLEALSARLSVAVPS